ncbi:MAG: aromatic amino acid lyase [Flavobacteriales bacterium]|nr:aromatic amino acid lyase [Flavobacteriales bacterium]
MQTKSVKKKQVAVRDMDLDQFVRMVRGEEIFVPDDADLRAAERAFSFLKEFAKDKVIYGINTGFGPLAQYHISESEADRLQYNLVRSHASGLGAPLPDITVRAMMLSRAMTFLLGHSGVSMPLIERILLFLEHGVCPTVPQHGGVGASGDLVQQAHLGLALIGEGTGTYQGSRRPMAEIHKALGIAPVELHLRDGLGTVNGTACMTGIAAINVVHAWSLLDHALDMGALINEIVGAYDDHLSAELNSVKRHDGQNWVAEQLRERMAGGARTKKRHDHLYNGEQREDGSVFEDKVQEHYSIRCLPQILGPMVDTLRRVESDVMAELLSVDDNPVVDHDRGTVYHGGNFHGDQIALAMDQLKLAIVKLSMLTERQLNFLLNDKVNGRFPPFLNMGRPGLDYGLQGIQFTAVSTTAESQALSTSLYVHSIPNNNDNQDVVSMGTNAAWSAAKVIDNTAQVMAIQSLALAQAVDIAGLSGHLSKSNERFYSAVRRLAPAITKDSHAGPMIEAIRSELIVPDLFQA